MRRDLISRPEGNGRTACKCSVVNKEDDINMGLKEK
jgi:hypothetical protein